jgi:predicted Rossmann fold nucleotide-binding protein DprA/Smf involved in DNA uptake
MERKKIGQNEINYLAGLRQYLKSEVPRFISSIGNLDLLQKKPLALFSSVKCPGNLILKTYDLAQRLRDEGICVIGGFHSPMEKECLVILLRGSQPVIFCPNRGISGMRIPVTWKKSISEGRLLIVSPFDERLRRGTVQTALYRNKFVAALADRIFITYAWPGSKTETFCRQVMEWGKKVYTFEENKNLINSGTRRFSLWESSI